MRAIPARLTMPLLGKELVEQANHRRTYIMRLLYAALLFALSLWFIYQELGYGRLSDPQAMLGTGEEMFTLLVTMQHAGIFVFMPILICGSITQEKQNNSLALLLLTDLRPWEILFQKLIGRLVPMLTFLLLCLPLMGVAYALGGVDRGLLILGAVSLVLTCIQVAAFGLMLSAYCTSTVQALMACYLLGTVLRWCCLSCFTGPIVFDLSDIGVVAHVVWGISTVISIVVFLLLARIFLLRRAFAGGKPIMLGMFRRMDRYFDDLNKSFGGVVLIKGNVGLPGDRPIAWREMSKRVLGKPAYLVRILVVIELPVLIICYAATDWSGHMVEPEFLPGVLCFVWCLSVLLIVISAASVIASERSRQTLDVLLTVPLTGRQIIHQKMNSCWRLVAVVSVPLLTVIFFEAFLVDGPNEVDGANWLDEVAYPVAALVSLLIFLPLIAWLSMWVGLLMRQQSRAILTVLTAIVTWCVSPVLLSMVIFPRPIPRGAYDPGYLLVLLSPAAVVAMIEDGRAAPTFAGAGLLMFIAGAAYGAVALVLRWQCLRHADAYLGRVSEGTIVPNAVPAT